MRVPELRKRLNAALDKAEGRIANDASHGRLAAGLSNEGWAGGYAQALRDVEALLNGVEPNDHRSYLRQ